MRHLVVLVVAAGAALEPAIPAQPAGMTVCAGFNHLTNATSGGYALPSQRRLAVPFAVTSAINVDAVEWYFILSPIAPSLSIGGGSVDIRPDDPVTGLPSATPIATANWPNGPAGPNWSGATFATTAVLAPGIWWVSYSRAPLAGSQTLGYQDNPAGPDATPYAIETAGAWALQATPHRFKVRISAVTCSANPIPPAALVSAGPGCAGAGGVTTLQSVGGQLPTLGNAGFALELLNGAPNSTSFWFIAAFAQPNAAAIGGGCFVHLDLSSLLNLITLGVNPIVALPTNPGGGAILPAPIPNQPSLGGQVIAVQVAVADASAAAGFTTSNALQATFGT